MLLPYTQPHHRTHSARLQLVGLFNFLAVGDTATTRTPLPIGTLSRPSDRVFMYETADTRMIFDNVSVRDMRGMILSHHLHGYTHPETRVCGKCKSLQVTYTGHRGISRQGCLHCTGKTRVRAKFK